MSKDIGKIFCIGMGKTGTTSLEFFLKELGYQLGDQPAGELLIHDWAVRNFRPIIAHAGTAQAFQDIPFSLPFTFNALDAAFPNSKFIFSVRDTEQWYRSIVRFHGKILGTSRVPTADDLKQCPYRYKGFMYEAMKLIYGISEREPYEKSRLIRVYESHHRAVTEYFCHRPNSLLTVNLAEQDCAPRIMEFLGMPFAGQTIPHLNRSSI